MKRTLLAIAAVALPMLAQAGDFEITLDRTRGGMKQSQGKVEKKADQKWVGEINITNHSFKPTLPTEVKYMLFVKRQELGQKQGLDSVEKIKGKASIPALKAQEKTKVATSAVNLRHQELEAGWSYDNGGSAKADDTVSGVWVKLFQGEKEVGEYIDPPTVKEKYKWAQ